MRNVERAPKSNFGARLIHSSRIKLTEFYFRAVLDRPKLVLATLAVVSLVMLGFVPRVELDASAESLALEDDEDLQFYRTISERFQTKEFLLLTYQPRTPIFSETALEHLEQLQKDLEALEQVDSVLSILNAPLLENPPVPLTELLDNVKTLKSTSADFELAQAELKHSPFFSGLILNEDATITSLVINLRPDQVHRELINRREALRAHGSPHELDTINRKIREYNALMAKERHANIVEIRAIMDKFRDTGELHLGGVPMVADDMISFVRNDLMVFGISVLAFLIAALWIIFRSLRWVMVSMICCLVVTAVVTGILGVASWNLTVISSNFISLLIIITIALTIHLIVRYREIQQNKPTLDQKQKMRLTISRMYRPCLYTALTTMVAFSSLVVSGIRPVINFGWMMTVGITVAFTCVFLLFPALSLVMPQKVRANNRTGSNPVITFFAALTLRHGSRILVVALLLAGFGVWGITQLKVENSFINYFDESTEIYQGMKLVDRELGGTTPLDVILEFESDAAPADADETTNAAFDDDPFAEGEEQNAEQYWFTTHKLDKIRAVHRYLESLPEIGKVLSLATAIQIAESLNDGEPLNNMELGILYATLPDEYKPLIVTPFVSIEHNQTRISMRIVDSDENLRRDELLKRIQRDLDSNPELEGVTVRLSGMLVLYNNMLQSLFESQILTLGTVFVGIMAMFMVLFRSLFVAVIAIIPNLLAALIILGLMGWLKIPLDMMTITIAAITVGIAVDNTIHYIHRFRVEFPRIRLYSATVRRCHDSIGRAVYYTSLTIIAGFSILALSSFVPTVYFGLLTGLAMLTALIGALTLLPQLIISVKLFGNEDTEGKQS